MPLNNRRRGGRTAGRNSTSLGKRSDQDETTVELGSGWAALGVMILLGLGAFLATMFIFKHSPEDCRREALSNLRPAATPAANKVTTSSSGMPFATTSEKAAAAVEQKATPQVAAPPPPPPAVEVKPLPPADLSKLPPQCTAEQNAQVVKQLPAKGCLNQGYAQECSFTHATAKEDICHDPLSFREHYASTNVLGDTTQTFRSLFVRYNADDTTLIDMLRIGSHDDTTYKIESWPNPKHGGTADCPPQKAFALTPPTPRPVEAAVVSKDQWQETTLKDKIKLSKLDPSSPAFKFLVHPSSFAVGDGPNSLDTFVATKLADWKEDPIHYLRISHEDNHYDVLMGAKHVLRRVRLLEFETNFRGGWADFSLKTAIDSLRNDNAMVCYWYGGKPKDGSDGQNLWRVTDCWQSHYGSYIQWAKMICVNSAHADSQPVLDKMEQQFAETLKRDQVYGVA